jgi:hypothetical protein
VVGGMEARSGRASAKNVLENVNSLHISALGGGCWAQVECHPRATPSPPWRSWTPGGRPPAGSPSPTGAFPGPPGISALSPPGTGGR